MISVVVSQIVMIAMVVALISDSSLTMIKSVTMEFDLNWIRSDKGYSESCIWGYLVGGRHLVLKVDGKVAIVRKYR